MKMIQKNKFKKINIKNIRHQIWIIQKNNLKKQSAVNENYSKKEIEIGLCPNFVKVYLFT